MFSSVQSLSGVWLFMIPWTTACQAFLSNTDSWSLLKLISIESLMPSSHLILCCPPLLLPSIFPSIRVFSNESALCIRWPKYWSFSFNISPSSEHSGLVYFRMDWLDLLAFQGTLKSLLQHHSSKPSILWCSAFFIVQLTSIHDYWNVTALNSHSLHFNQVLTFVYGTGQRAFQKVWDDISEASSFLFKVLKSQKSTCIKEIKKS